MARNPKKKSRKSKSTKPKKKAPARRVTNSNTVKVHVINTVGGGDTPAPYTGPDRGYFAFNPVFDAGLPKQAIEPPMILWANIASGPIKRKSEISTRTGGAEGIFADYRERVNDSMSIGSGRGLSFADMSPRQPSPPIQPTPPATPKPDAKLPEEMSRNELRDVVRSMGIPVGSKKKAELLAIVQRGPA